MNHLHLHTNWNVIELMWSSSFACMHVVNHNHFMSQFHFFTLLHSSRIDCESKSVIEFQFQWTVNIEVKLNKFSNSLKNLTFYLGATMMIGIWIVLVAIWSLNVSHWHCWPDNWVIRNITRIKERFVKTLATNWIKIQL